MYNKSVIDYIVCAHACARACVCAEHGVTLRYLKHEISHE